MIYHNSKLVEAMNINSKPVLTIYHNSDIVYSGEFINELSGIPPLSFLSNGKPLVEYQIDGKATQNGTPTFENPVMPQSTGERSSNLVESYLSGCNIDANGKLINNASYNMFYAKVEQGRTYCLDSISTVGSFYENLPTIGSISYDGQRVSFGLSAFIAPINGYLAYRKEASSEKTAMVNEGNELLPYEPYGIKIPISSASVTTPIYLGEVQSIRRVKKLVFNGTETIYYNTIDKNRLIIQVVYTLPQSGTTTATNIICTHLVTLNSASATSLQQGIAMRYNGTDILFGVPFSRVGATTDDSNATILTKVKSYLATQYANGTPMTIWYVLATETAGIVNEPLMKIGDYADELHSIDAGVEIPTVKGVNTLTVDTTVQPSSVSIKYKSNRKVIDDAMNDLLDVMEMM